MGTRDALFMRCLEGWEMKTNIGSRPVPPLSVGMPVFNGQDYLRTSLDSILGQTFGDFELIIADNASTDATPEIIAEYAARDPRIRQFRHDRNTGVGNNWAFVARQARAPLLKWVTADDMWLPRAFEECVAALDDDPTAVLAYTRTELMDLSGQPIDVYGGDFAALSNDPLDRYRMVRKLLGLSTPIQAGIVRTEAVRRCGYLGNYRESDRVLIAGLALLGKFVLLPHVLFRRRWSPKVCTPLRSSLEIERMYRPDARREPVFANLPRWMGQLDVAIRAPYGLQNKAASFVAALRCTEWRRKFGLMSSAHASY